MMRMKLSSNGLLLLVLMVALISIAATWGYTRYMGPGGSPLVEFWQDGSVSMNDLANGPLAVTMIGQDTVGTGSAGDVWIGHAVWSNSDSTKCKVQLRGLFKGVKYDATVAPKKNEQVEVNGSGYLRRSTENDSLRAGGPPGSGRVLAIDSSDSTCTVWK